MLFSSPDNCNASPAAVFCSSLSSVNSPFRSWAPDCGNRCSPYCSQPETVVVAQLPRGTKMSCFQIDYSCSLLLCRKTPLSARKIQWVSELQSTGNLQDEILEEKRYLFGYQVENVDFDRWPLFKWQSLGRLQRCIRALWSPFILGWCGRDGLGNVAAAGCALTMVAVSSSSQPSTALPSLFKFIVKVFSKEKTNQYNPHTNK